jgi:hypothetical protein
MLDETQVTDAGLECLKGLSQLYELSLNDTTVTDAGLEYLRGLTNLKLLFLDRTHVTDEGVKQIRQALPKCECSNYSFNPPDIF